MTIRGKDPSARRRIHYLIENKISASSIWYSPGMRSVVINGSYWNKPESLAAVGSRVVEVAEAEDEAGAEALGQLAHVDRLQVGHGHGRAEARLQGRSGYDEARPGGLPTDLENVLRWTDAVVYAVVHGLKVVLVSCEEKDLV